MNEREEFGSLCVTQDVRFVNKRRLLNYDLIVTYKHLN
jgi:hypothetical protein